MSTKRANSQTTIAPEPQAPEAHANGVAVEVETKTRTRSGAAEPPPCADQPLELRVEALLLATDRPLGEGRIAELLELNDAKPSAAVRAAIESLNAAYKHSGRSFRIDKLAGGWQMLTLPTFGPILSRLARDRQQSNLTQAALETLAIIAYRQPILRADVEAIRGVACGEVLRGLLERRMVKVVGRAEELGRPMLYGTTREFLKTFGLSALTDLPPVEGLASGPRRKIAQEPPVETATTEASAV